MDTKRLVISITLTLALLLGWRLFMNHLHAVHPGWFEPTAPLASTEDASTTKPVSATTQSIYASTTMPGSVAASTQPAGPSTGTGAVDAPVALQAMLGNDPESSKDLKYQMSMSLSSKGAGLDGVTLSDFWETAQQQKHYVFQRPTEGAEAVTRPLATRSVKIDGQDVDLSSVTWTQTTAAADTATYSTLVMIGGKPALHLSKTFKLLPRDSSLGSGFDVQVKQNFRNLTDKPLKVSVTFNGPTPPARENDRSEDRRYVSGYDQGFKSIDTSSAGVGDFAKDKPAKDLVGANSLPMVWIGACSSYFESIYQPDYAGQAGLPTVRLVAASVLGVDLHDDKRNDNYPTQLALTTNDFTLAPGGGDALDAHVFFGPKKRELLKDAYYSAFPRAYDSTLLYKSGPCGYITFTWLINTLYFILWCFHRVFFDWGVAIICLVALVRTLLHPITKKSQINMLEMSKKGPELERLKKKFGDDKEALLKAQAELMNPLGMVFGCLPMFLQTPIWIALWSALQSTFELRQAGFLRHGSVHLTWISDLSHPDALFTFAPMTLNLLFFHPVISQINVLPLLLAVVFFVQQQMQPAPPNMTPEQEQQRKMMKWMSLLFPIMLYSGPSGLTLYIMTSTTIGIIESKIIRDHIKQRDEAEKAGRIIVDAAPTRNSKNRGKGNLSIGSKPEVAKSGGIAGWLADLQAKADQIKREAARRGNK